MEIFEAIGESLAEAYVDNLGEKIVEKLKPKSSTESLKQKVADFDNGDAKKDGGFMYYFLQAIYLISLLGEYIATRLWFLWIWSIPLLFIFIEAGFNRKRCFELIRSRPDSIQTKDALYIFENTIISLVVIFNLVGPFNILILDTLFLICLYIYLSGYFVAK